MAVLDELFAAAKAAQEKAYVPYSRFRVGSALLADDGRIYAGCNVENAAYPSGTCAEAGTIAAMALGGGRAIREILVIGDGAASARPAAIAASASANSPHRRRRCMWRGRKGSGAASRWENCSRPPSDRTT